MTKKAHLLFANLSEERREEKTSRLTDASRLACGDPKYRLG